MCASQSGKWKQTVNDHNHLQRLQQQWEIKSFSTSIFYFVFWRSFKCSKFLNFFPSAGKLRTCGLRLYAFKDFDEYLFWCCCFCLSRDETRWLLMVHIVCLLDSRQLLNAIPNKFLNATMHNRTKKFKRFATEKTFGELILLDESTFVLHQFLQQCIMSPSHKSIDNLLSTKFIYRVHWILFTAFSVLVHLPVFGLSPQIQNRYN